MELSDEEKQRLAAMLGAEPDAPAYDHRLEMLKNMAAEEYVDWLLARRRFESVSALDHKRILEVFSHIRGEAPSVESLANEFGISESRAVSMLSRMRYGSARIIRQLQYAAAGREIEQQRQDVEAENGLLYLWLRRETARIVEEANTSIMRDAAARRPGGRYEGASSHVRARQGATTSNGQPSRGCGITSPRGLVTTPEMTPTMSLLDPLALWAALAAVAAITSAIQASAAFAMSGRVDELEDRDTRAGTQERRQLKDDARRAGWRLGAVNVVSLLLSGGVVAAWAHVTFEQVPQSWIFIVPWITVCGATVLLAAFGVVSLGIRSYSLATKAS